MSQSFIRVNVGPGVHPLPGWINIDYSLSSRCIRLIPLLNLLSTIGLFSKKRIKYLMSLSRENLVVCDITRLLPFKSNSVDIIYSSHVLNCYTPERIISILIEFHRILKPSGKIRLVLPDIDKVINDYLLTQNSYLLIERIYARRLESNSLKTNLMNLIGGMKHYLTQDNISSFSNLLIKSGFKDIVSLPPGKSLIQNIYPVNLREHQEESFYIEAQKT